MLLVQMVELSFKNDLNDGGGIGSRRGPRFLPVLCRAAMASDWLDPSPGTVHTTLLTSLEVSLLLYELQFSSLRVLLRDGAVVVRGRRSLLRTVRSPLYTGQIRGGEEGSGSQQARRRRHMMGF